MRAKKRSLHLSLSRRSFDKVLAIFCHTSFLFVALKRPPLIFIYYAEQLPGKTNTPFEPSFRISIVVTFNGIIFKHIILCFYTFKKGYRKFLAESKKTGKQKGKTFFIWGRMRWHFRQRSNLRTCMCKGISCLCVCVKIPPELWHRWARGWPRATKRNITKGKCTDYSLLGKGSHRSMTRKNFLTSGTRNSCKL